MSFNPSSAQEGRDGGHEQRPPASTELALTATATATAASHVYSGEQHDDYEKVVASGTVCDGCESSSSPPWQKCKTCGWKTCRECHNRREYEHRHILTDLQLDWSYGSSNNQQGKRTMSADAGDEAQPVAKRPKLDNASEREPAAETVSVSQNSLSQDAPSRESLIASETQPSTNQTNANTNGEEASRLGNVSAQEDRRATLRTRAGRNLKPFPMTTGLTMPVLPTSGSSVRLELREVRKGANSGPNNAPLNQSQAPNPISLGPNGRVPTDPDTGLPKQVVLAPNHHNYIAMAVYWEQQGKYVEADQYRRLADQEARKNGLAPKNRGANSKQNSKPASTVVGAITNAKDAQGSEFQQQETTLTEATLSHATTSNANASMTTPGNVTLGEAITSIATTSNATTSIATTSIATTSNATTSNATTNNATTSYATTSNITSGEATTNETSLNTTNIGGNAHALINLDLSGSDLEWNKEAFPGADESRFIRYLMRGGQETIEHARQLRSPNYLHPPQYVTDMKAALATDPWAVKEPERFERQWELVEFVVWRWYNDNFGPLSERITSNELDPLHMLETRMYYSNPGMVRSSFWEIWVEGMRRARRALQEPTSN